MGNHKKKKNVIFKFFLKKIVMEFIDGLSVTQLISSYEALPEPIISLICKKTSKGLDYLHNNSIIHRDIKSDNIIAGVNGDIKISN